MAYITKDDIDYIYERLLEKSLKDSLFPLLEEISDGDYATVVHQGNNYKVKIKLLLHSNSIVDINKYTSKESLTLWEAIISVHKDDRSIGVIITFKNTSLEFYYYFGNTTEDSDWYNTDNWYKLNIILEDIIDNQSILIVNNKLKVNDSYLNELDLLDDYIQFILLHKPASILAVNSLYKEFSIIDYFIKYSLLNDWILNDKTKYTIVGNEYKVFNPNKFYPLEEIYYLADGIFKGLGFQKKDSWKFDEFTKSLTTTEDAKLLIHSKGTLAIIKGLNINSIIISIRDLVFKGENYLVMKSTGNIKLDIPKDTLIESITTFDSTDNIYSKLLDYSRMFNWYQQHKDDVWA